LQDSFLLEVRSSLFPELVKLRAGTQSPTGDLPFESAQGLLITRGQQLPSALSEAKLLAVTVILTPLGSGISLGDKKVLVSQMLREELMQDIFLTLQVPVEVADVTVDPVFSALI
jgi:hypothetical protein